MHWSEIDLDRGLWLIPLTKNGESHLTVLTDEAVAVLRRRKRKATSVFVLPGSGKTGHVEGIRKAWKRALDNAGIDGLWIHDLRRTMGSYMANNGAHPIQIAMQLGHKSVQSSKPYVHANVEYTRGHVMEVTKTLSAKRKLK
jgi:integrase